MSAATVLGAAPIVAGRDTRGRIVDATLRCVARWGLARTTVDDVAREAGVGRATLYRWFPGGRDALLDAVVADETARLVTRIRHRLEAAASLEDALVGCIAETGGSLVDHGAVQFLLAHEPEAILPYLAFGRLDALLRRTAALGGPLLEPWLPAGDGAATAAERGARAAEWMARIVLSYVVAPTPEVDIRDTDSVRRLVRAFILPGLAPAVPRSAP